MKPPQKNWALKISTLVVVTACFAVIAVTLLISKNFQNVLSLWGEDVQMTVYLSQEISAEDKNLIETKLKETGKVGEIQYISQDKALSEFRTQLASYAPDVSKDDELLRMIPASIQFPLSKDISPEEQMATLSTLAAMLKEMDGVDEVSYGQDWIQKYSLLVTAIQTVLQTLCFVILVASIFVMSNAIRASIQSRKEEIVVLEMIGATPSMIRRPFIIEGAALGLLASLLSLGLSFGLYAVIRNLLATKLSFLQISEHFTFLTALAMVALIFGGTFLGSLGSYLCVRRLNDGFAGSQGS